MLFNAAPPTTPACKQHACIKNQNGTTSLEHGNARVASASLAPSPPACLPSSPACLHACLHACMAQASSCLRQWLLSRAAVLGLTALHCYGTLACPCCWALRVPAACCTAEACDWRLAVLPPCAVAGMPPAPHGHRCAPPHCPWPFSTLNNLVDRRVLPHTWWSTPEVSAPVLQPCQQRVAAVPSIGQHA